MRTNHSTAGFHRQPLLWLGLLATSLLWLGCPETEEEEPTLGQGTMSVVGDLECGPLKSICWIDSSPGQDAEFSVYATTIPGYCAKLGDYLALVMDEDLAAEIEAAASAGEYQQACLLARDSVAEFQPVVEPMFPAGSCTLQLSTFSDEPGDYRADGSPLDGDWILGVLTHSTGFSYDSALDAYGDCSQATDLDSYTALLGELEASTEAALDLWMAVEGTVEIQKDDDGYHLLSTDLGLEHTGGDELQVELDLMPDLCELDD